MRRWACVGVVFVVGCGDGAGGADTAAPGDTVVDTADTSEGDADTGSGDTDTGSGDTDDTSGEDTADGEVVEGSAFERLVARYDLLTTIAGRGRQRDQGVEWVSAYEGGPATAAELSRPHMAMADAAGRVFIADKEAHAVRRVDPDGTIHTVAGTGALGDDGDGPGQATAMRLGDPNGLHVTASGVVFIVDLDNGKIRRLATDGTMTTFITVAGGISTGRGLWVSDDEQLAYIASGSRVLRWQAGVGVKILATGFVSLGNLAVDPEPHPAGRLVVTDRGGHHVYRIGDSGEKTPIAGTGTLDDAVGGGEGGPALATALDEPRAIAFTGDGGYLVGTHEGNQVWYVDATGDIHLFLDGGDAHAHSGDGENFRTPGEKVSEVRAITLDTAGNVIVTENDYGYIRMVKRR